MELTVECRGCLQSQMEFLYDDLIEESLDSSITKRARKQAARKARKVKRVAGNDRKMARVEKFVAEKTTAHYLAAGNVGAFGDGAILDWLKDGGFEELLKFILGIMGGIADIFLVLPFIAMCVAVI